MTTRAPGRSETASGSTEMPTGTMDMTISKFCHWDAFSLDQITRWAALALSRDVRFDLPSILRATTNRDAPIVRDIDTLVASLRVLFVEPLVAVTRPYLKANDLGSTFTLGSDLNFKNAMDRHSPPGNAPQPYFVCTYKRPGQDHNTPAYVIVPKMLEEFDGPILQAGLSSLIARNLEATARPPADFTPRNAGEAVFAGLADVSFTTMTDFDAEAQVVESLIQAFRLMIDDGLTYGCVMTTEVVVFLKIDYEADPITLLAHLFERGTDSGKSLGVFSDMLFPQAQCFTVLALDSMSRDGPRSAADRQRASRDLDAWAARIRSRRR